MEELFHLTTNLTRSWQSKHSQSKGFWKESNNDHRQMRPFLFPLNRWTVAAKAYLPLLVGVHFWIKNPCIITAQFINGHQGTFEHLDAKRFVPNCAQLPSLNCQMQHGICRLLGHCRGHCSYHSHLMKLIRARTTLHYYCCHLHLMKFQRNLLGWCLMKVALLFL